MEQVLKLINKLMKDKNKFIDLVLNENSSEEKIKFYNWFSIMNNDSFIKLFNEIHKYIGTAFDDQIKLILYNTNIDLDKEDVKSLFTIYIIKAVQKTHDIVSYKSIHYKNSYEVLDKIYNFHTNFCVFYTNNTFNNDIKKTFFKIITILVKLAIVHEKKIIENNKTLIFWSFNIASVHLKIDYFIKYSNYPWCLIKINDDYYLKNSFFQDTTSLFRRNIQSKKKIIFKNDIYLNKLLKSHVYLDMEAFKDIKSIIEKDIGFELGNLRDKINEHINKIIMNNLHIENLENNSKSNYAKHSNLELENILTNCISNKEKFLKIISEGLGKEIKKANISILESYNDRYWKTINIEKLTEILNNNKLGEDKLDYAKIDNEFLLTLSKNLKILKSTNKNYKLFLTDVIKYQEENKKIQSQVSKLLILYKLKIIENLNLENKKIYFPFFFEFRGRFFIDSTIGITDFKLSRYFYHYGQYSEKEIIKSSNNTITVLKNYNKHINTIRNEYKINKIYDSAIFWILISLGKEFIIKNKSKISTDEILETGIKVALHQIDPKNLEKTIIKSHYLRILNSLNKNILYKRFVHKDATASFIQNSIRIFGAKNHESLELSNLADSQNWYDPYNLALEKWKNSLIIKNNRILFTINDKVLHADVKLLDYFNRKTSKHPLMTGPYAAKYVTILGYFSEAIKNEFNININEHSDLPHLFQNFNTFIDKSFWTDYYLSQSPKILLTYINNLLDNNKSITIQAHDAETNLIYYKFKNTTWDLIIEIPIYNKKIRKTKSYRIIDSENIDMRKIKDSIRANCVHFIEALLVRDINSHFNPPLLSIHDCFLVDILNVNKFINVANTEIHKDLSLFIKNDKAYNKKTYSIFIFI